MGHAKARAEEAKTRVKENAVKAGEHVKDEVVKAGEHVKDEAIKAGQKVRADNAELEGKIRTTAQEGVDTAKTTAANSKGQAIDLMDSNKPTITVDTPGGRKSSEDFERVHDDGESSADEVILVPGTSNNKGKAKKGKAKKRLEKTRKDAVKSAKAQKKAMASGSSFKAGASANASVNVEFSNSNPMRSGQTKMVNPMNDLVVIAEPAAAED